jgi:hypothetical protein
MTKTGKVTDSDNIELIGVIIAESDSTGKYKSPNPNVITTNVNGVFSGDFKNNTFYTVSYVGYKKFTFNTANGIPKVIKLENDFTLPDIEIKSTRTYYWLIPIGLLMLVLLRKK